MDRSLAQFTDDVARRGSWYGGGSVAALSTALAAALLEKFTASSRARRPFERIRRECLALVRRDAEVFAGVIQTKAAHDHRAFQRALQDAIRIPWRISVCARRLARAGEVLRRKLPTAYHADVRCAVALADAAQRGAVALITTNLAWLGDGATSRRMRRRLARLT